MTDIEKRNLKGGQGDAQRSERGERPRETAEEDLLRQQQLSKERELDDPTAGPTPSPREGANPPREGTNPPGGNRPQQQEPLRNVPPPAEVKPAAQGGRTEEGGEKTPTKEKRTGTN